MPATPSSWVPTPSTIGPGARCGSSGTRCRDKWFSDGTTGKELYEYAVAAAERLGWTLNLDLTGHRLSDFPHSVHYAGRLADIEFRPTPNLWVLEIVIVHPDGTFGAFYEDLLLEDQSFPA